MRDWFLSPAVGGRAETWDDDKKMIMWLTDNAAQFSSYVARRRAEALSASLAERAAACDEDGLRLAVAAMAPEVRARLLAALK
jgi:hypothetical protein